MEKNSTHERRVVLENSFEDVWKTISGKDIELETEDLKTPFLTRALMAKRRDSSDLVEVLVFLRSDGSGKLKECSRCYADDWGYYFNHLGREGQRIGMYCKAFDIEVSLNF